MFFAKRSNLGFSGILVNKAKSMSRNQAGCKTKKPEGPKRSSKINGFWYINNEKGMDNGR